jgi:hypothetical protein
MTPIISELWNSLRLRIFKKQSSPSATTRLVLFIRLSGFSVLELKKVMREIGFELDQF